VDLLYAFSRRGLRVELTVCFRAHAIHGAAGPKCFPYR
jgi:hypothetical protein